MFIPSILTFAVNDIPLLYSTILLWLRPLYVFVIINTLIITIAATSCFHHHTNYNKVQSQPLDRLSPVTVLPMIVYEDVNTLPEVSTMVYEVDNAIIDDELVEVNDKEVLVVNEAEDIHEVMRPTWQSPVEKVQTEFGFPVREKPLAGSRFVDQRKLTAKVNPEEYQSQKKHETLESTWKTITDGRHIPLNHHLKKSDTFENHNQLEPKLDYNAMKKLETFNDRTDEIDDGDGLSFDEWRDYSVVGDDYEGPLMFNDDQFKDKLEMGDYAFVLIGKEVSPNSEIPEAMFPLLEEFSDVSSNSEIPKAMFPLLEEFFDVFHDELPDALQPLCNIQHHINLEPSLQLPNKPHYRLCPGEHEELRRQVEE
nr:CFE protein [Tanacetum cinerariifolium]